MDMNRRDFFCALAASAVVAGAPLPIGFPEEMEPDWAWLALERIYTDLVLYGHAVVKIDDIGIRHVVLKNVSQPSL